MIETFIQKAIVIYDSIGQEITLKSVSPTTSELFVNDRLILKIDKEGMKHFGRMFDQFYNEGF